MRFGWSAARFFALCMIIDYSCENKSNYWKANRIERKAWQENHVWVARRSCFEYRRVSVSDINRSQHLDHGKNCFHQHSAWKLTTLHEFFLTLHCFYLLFSIFFSSFMFYINFNPLLWFPIFPWILIAYSAISLLPLPLHL